MPSRHRQPETAFWLLNGPIHAYILTCTLWQHRCNRPVNKASNLVSSLSSCDVCRGTHGMNDLSEERGLCRMVRLQYLHLTETELATRAPAFLPQGESSLCHRRSSADGCSSLKGSNIWRICNVLSQKHAERRITCPSAPRMVVRVGYAQHPFLLC